MPLLVRVLMLRLSQHGTSQSSSQMGKQDSVVFLSSPDDILINGGLQLSCPLGFNVITGIHKVLSCKIWVKHDFHDFLVKLRIVYNQYIFIFHVVEYLGTKNNQMTFHWPRPITMVIPRYSLSKRTLSTIHELTRNLLNDKIYWYQHDLIQGKPWVSDSNGCAVGYFTS